MNSLILGAGYAGINSYHILKTNIIAEKEEFVFYTAYLRNLINNRPFSKELTFIKREKVIDIDLKSKWVKTDKCEYNPDYLIVALGCDKTDILIKINEIKRKNELNIASEDPLNDYLAIQLAFYFKNLGKDVKYYGDYLQYLGEKVSSTIRYYMEKYGIKETERPEDVIPSCKPPHPFSSFLRVNEYLQYENSFVIGDLIQGYPKLGELAMRTGIYAANYILGKNNSPFRPIFITIIDTGKEGIHIRSDKLWNGKMEVVKVSKIRQLMKRFIERYYLIRNGKMGFLYYL
ncbi:hypothetical protein EWF20_09025 [Sulfolobus sp. S-194]|uniref:hypothetical protein n=1 Tax=Sulfolobus sp. S-194 TaxID=2512240 RepID=UPI001436D97A|nr:hypothetical protein [Sulfolobus sp. S-194]QIW24273.1 hypothetical protein EWF20_09025 [Sulfolobus sp. S-194]